jgi:hypothetical protein
MSTPVTPLGPSASALRRGGWYDPNMRIGDAERADVADRLAKHYSDGRLDHAEFSERLDRAMKAKTMAELGGLLADLPETEPLPAPVPIGMAGNRRHERRMMRVQLERQREHLRHERREYRRATRQHRLSAVRWLVVVVALVIVTVATANFFVHAIGIWLVLGLLVVLWLSRHRNQGGP